MMLALRCLRNQRTSAGKVLSRLCANKGSTLQVGDYKMLNNKYTTTGGGVMLYLINTRKIITTALFTF